MPAQAKPLKKATKKHARYERAQRNLRLATIAGFIEGEARQMLLLNDQIDMKFTQTEIDQLNKILLYTNQVFTNVPLGKRALQQSLTLIHRATELIEQYIGKDLRHAGQIIQIWLAISYLTNESASIATRAQITIWPSLIDAVDNWLEIVWYALREGDEEQAGMLAEKLRELIIAKEA